MPKIKTLEFKRTMESTPVPRRGSAEAAGFDLGLPSDVLIHPGQVVMVDMGIALNIPEGHYLEVNPRSSTCDAKDSAGNLLNQHIVVLANTVGVIDSDYTGSIRLRLTNNGTDTYLGYAGDFIMQAILKEFTQVEELVEVNEISKQTDRGDKNFGSTDG